MGKVFSESELIRGAVPSSPEFNEAAELLLRWVDESKDEGLIDGGIIFGSTAIHAAGVRSDLDCMVVPKTLSQDSQEEVIDLLWELEKQFPNVPINPIIHHRARLEAGEHEIDRFFGAHLKGEHRLVAGNDPAEYMKFPKTSATDTLLGYIRHKKRGVNNLFGMVGSLQTDKLKDIQRMIELPLAIGRKALAVIDEVEGSERAVPSSADKLLMMNPVMDLFVELGVESGARKIKALDDTYNDLLQQFLAREIDYGTYDAFVFGDMFHGSINASRWLDELDRAVQLRLIKK